MVFFDRSWYNRAVVEPVNGFCTLEEHERFLKEVVDFENMLVADGIHLIKFYFSISKEEQRKRFESIVNDPLKRWKMSPVDERAQELWDEYTKYKKEMFARTHTEQSPWVVIKADRKPKARLESMRYVLNKVPYKGSATA
jgi:polyphosphate kinase 2 (PPK2 family)